MSNTPEKKEIAVVYNVDGNEIKLTPSIVQQYIVGTNAQITMPEYKFFTELCKARGLNPFLKEAYCIKFSDKNPAQIVVGKDAILKRAILNPHFDGMESGVIVQVNETGEIVERNGTFYIRGTEKLVGGWAKVYRKNWTHPTYTSVSFDEVAQRKGDGSLNSNWSGKSATMVEKVAKVRALRETFIEQLGGMYEAEEMGVDLPQAQPQPQEAPIIQQAEPTIIDAQPTEVSMSDL